MSSADKLSRVIRDAVYAKVQAYDGVPLDGSLRQKFKRDVIAALKVEIRRLNLTPPGDEEWDEILTPLVERSIAALSRPAITH